MRSAQENPVQIKSYSCRNVKPNKLNQLIDWNLKVINIIPDFHHIPYNSEYNVLIFRSSHSRGVFMKRCPENMQQIYRRTEV